MSGFFSLAGRMRLLMEPFVAARHEDETVAAFTRRRLGQEMLDYVMDPLAAGLYAGDSQQLSVSAVFPQLKRLERCHGSIVLGTIGSRWRRDGQSAIYGPGKRMLFWSTLFPGRAPEGHVALTAFVGGARQPRLALLEPDELAALVNGEVRQLLGGRTVPVVARTRCWRRGLPQPGVDHAQRFARIAAAESEHAGLFLTGNYISGVSTAACIEQAVRTAGRVEYYLAGRSGGARKAA